VLCQPDAFLAHANPAGEFGATETVIDPKALEPKVRAPGAWEDLASCCHCWRKHAKTGVKMQALAVNLAESRKTKAVAGDDDTEYAARVRAARAYSGMAAKPFARALKVSARTLSRIENNEPTKERSRQEPEIVADTTGVPVWFMQHGFNPPPSSTLEERVARLEREVRARQREDAGAFLERLAHAVAQEHQRTLAQPAPSTGGSDRPRQSAGGNGK